MAGLLEIDIYRTDLVKLNIDVGPVAERVANAGEVMIGNGSAATRGQDRPTHRAETSRNPIYLGGDGAPVHNALIERTLTATTTELLHIPTRFGVTFDGRKLHAARPVVRSRLINNLIVHRALAEEMLAFTERWSAPGGGGGAPRARRRTRVHDPDHQHAAHEDERSREGSARFVDEPDGGGHECSPDQPAGAHQAGERDRIRGGGGDLQRE
jgi:hypothetical protein